MSELLGVLSASSLLEGRKNAKPQLPPPGASGVKANGQCYGELGCFYEAFPFPQIGLLPLDPQTMDVKFRLADTDSESVTGLKYRTMSQSARDQHHWSDVSANTSRLTFLIHGFNENYASPAWANLTKALLDNTDDKVVLVDWSRGAAYPMYEQAVANTQIPARLIAHFVENLRGYRKLNTDRVHLIGLGLGAHLAGHAGRYAYEKFGYKLARITGLDPVWTMFESYANAPLAKSDAKLVDVIHTSAGTSLLMGEMGFRRAVGHVDFYPNRGTVPQPHCELQPFFAPVDCSQYAAIRYFTASLLHDCQFTSLQCTSWDEYRAHACDTDDESRKSRLGYYADATAGRGVHYLETLPAWPHCMPEARKALHNNL